MKKGAEIPSPDPSKRETAPSDTKDSVNIAQRAFEHEYVQTILRMNVLNFSQGLEPEAKDVMREILIKFLKSAVEIALTHDIPEPDMSLKDWKEDFANTFEGKVFDTQEFRNLVQSTQGEIRNRYPNINSPMIFTDYPYYELTQGIGQIAHMMRYGVDPKYLFLTPTEQAQEIKQRIKTAAEAGKDIEVKTPDEKKNVN